jgi:phage terminase large subunit
MKRKIVKWQEKLYLPHRYKIIYGGRGSGKSYGVADALIMTSLSKPCLILCSREFQNSIKDSVHYLISQRIKAMNLIKYFNIKRDEIVNPYSESRFIFKGLRHHVESVQSYPEITHLWIEEAATISRHTWTVLKPTIRIPGSEIWATLNPKNKTDVIYQDFIANIPPDNAYVAKVNYMDNPYFTDVLRDEMLADRKKDYGHYRHVWEGECLERSDSQVFHRTPPLWSVEDFKEDTKSYPYYGLDFGYSIDPTAAIRCYIKNNTLYITHEFYQKNIEIDDVGKKCEQAIPGFNTGKIIADSARPDTISFMRRQGYRIEGSEKGKGSVADGIAFIRSFDAVIIHPRCVATINEFNLYSYKTDERSGDITTNIIDDYNHSIDALRYGLERIMKHRYADYEVLGRI